MKQTLLLVVLGLFATAAVADMPAGHPAMSGGAMHLPQVNADAPLSQVGKVQSVMATQGFTYIEVKQNEKTLWIAVPTTQVKAGDTVHFQDIKPMDRYHSTSLDRTFYHVIFTNRVQVDPAK